MAGEMSPEMYEYVRGLLNLKVPSGKNCIVCGQGKVILAQHLVTPIVTSTEGGVQLGSSQYPQAMLMCQNCGYTTYHNYVMLQASVLSGN